MRIHEIVIIPGAGHSGPGIYDRGHAMDALIEVDLVDKYCSAISDELDNAGIRNRTLPTRKAPGLSPLERASVIMPNALVLHCRIGWNQSKKVKATNNLSCVYFRTPESAGMARELAQIVGHWGSLYVHGHREGNPALNEDDDLLCLPTTSAVRIEPFQLNAPNALEYAKRLHNLGRDIGRFLADHCRDRNHSAANRPTTYASPRDRSFI